MNMIFTVLGHLTGWIIAVAIISTFIWWKYYRRGAIDERSRGLYRKFKVVRTDGGSARGKKHENCRYFVLDLDHDKYALPAMKAYATACSETHRELFLDLVIEIDQMESRFGKSPEFKKENP